MKIRDVVSEVSQAEIPNKLRERSDGLRLLSVELIDKLGRTNESVAYSNFAKRIGNELDSLATSYPHAVESLAMCTRNVFELNLIIRHTLRDPSNLKTWLGQIIRDEEDIIEGFLRLGNPECTRITNDFEARLSELKSISERYGIESAKPFNIRQLAESECLHDEYVSLFKLYSKYIHPSSWIVNSPNNEGFLTQSDASNIFVIHSQIYAEDSCVRIGDWLAVQLEDKVDLAACGARRNEETVTFN